MKFDPKYDKLFSSGSEILDGQEEDEEKYVWWQPSLNNNNKSDSVFRNAVSLSQQQQI